MRKFLFSASVFSICFLVPLAAAADENTHRKALEALLDMFDMEETLEESVEQMVSLQVQQNPQFGLYKDVLKRFYKKHMNWENLKEEFVAIYMEEFSEDEDLVWVEHPQYRSCITIDPDGHAFELVVPLRETTKEEVRISHPESETGR